MASGLGGRGPLAVGYSRSPQDVRWGPDAAAPSRAPQRLPPTQEPQVRPPPAGMGPWRHGPSPVPRGNRPPAGRPHRQSAGYPLADSDSASSGLLLIRIRARPVWLRLRGGYVAELRWCCLLRLRWRRRRRAALSIHGFHAAPRDVSDLALGHPPVHHPLINQPLINQPCDCPAPLSNGHLGLSAAPAPAHHHNEGSHHDHHSTYRQIDLEQLEHGQLPGQAGPTSARTRPAPAVPLRPRHKLHGGGPGLAAVASGRCRCCCGNPRSPGAARSCGAGQAGCPGTPSRAGRMRWPLRGSGCSAATWAARARTLESRSSRCARSSGVRADRMVFSMARMPGSN